MSAGLYRVSFDLLVTTNDDEQLTIDESKNVIADDVETSIEKVRREEMNKVVDYTEEDEEVKSYRVKGIKVTSVFFISTVDYL